MGSTAQYEGKEPIARKAIRLNVILGIILLASVVLLPRGVGIVGFSILQLPRLAAIALVFLAGAYICVSQKILLKAPRTMKVIVIISCLQFLAALNSDSIFWSVQWAINYAIMIFLSAFGFLLLSGSFVNRKKIVKAFMVISVLLASISVFEFVTQSKLFPQRNIYAEHSERFSTNIRRLVVENDQLISTPFASIGPFMHNLMFSGFLCCMGGILILGWQKKSAKWNFLGTALFAFSVLGTQSRSGFIAMLVMLGVSAAVTEKRKKRIAILSGGLLGICVYLGFCGLRMAFIAISGSGQAVMRLTSVLVLVILFLLSIPAISFVAKRKRALLACFFILPVLVMMLFFVKTSGEEYAGSFWGRVHGIKALFSQAEVWLLGAGPGSLVDSERVSKSFELFSDQGSFFTLIGESGILVGVLLLYLVYIGVRGGLHRSNDSFVQAMGVGVLGGFITCLSSVVPDIWLMIVVLCGLIEAWRSHGFLKEHRYG